MFLNEVETKPGTGPYDHVVQGMHSQGILVPEILHLFRFKPGATEHLARFSQEVMRGPSPLSPGLRELIAAFVSQQNQCPF